MNVTEYESGTNCARCLRRPGMIGRGGHKLDLVLVEDTGDTFCTDCVGRCDDCYHHCDPDDDQCAQCYGADIDRAMGSAMGGPTRRKREREVPDDAWEAKMER